MFNTGFYGRKPSRERRLPCWSEQSQGELPVRFNLVLAAIMGTLKNPIENLNPEVVKAIKINTILILS